MGNVLIQGKSSTDQTKVVEILVDPHTGSIQVIQLEHAKIHQGDAYAISGKETGLANAATAYIYAVTGASHIHWRAASVTTENGEVDIAFYEAPTVSANGTLVPSFNKNRVSTNTSDLTVYAGPTVTDNGTLLETGWVPPTGGVGSHASGGEVERVGGEWILLPNSSYLISITNNSGGAIDYSYTYFWYED